MTKPQPVLKLTAVLLLLVFLVGIIAVSYTESQGLKPVEAKKVIKAEPMKIFKTKGRYEPTLYSWNKTHIKVKGARDTTGLLRTYNRQPLKLWKNYCPHCRKWGTLRFESSRTVRHWTSIEGLIYCKRCDMDFGLATGKEHIKGSKYYLKKW